VVVTQSDATERVPPIRHCNLWLLTSQPLSFPASQLGGFAALRSYRQGEVMRGPVGPRTSFGCWLQVVLVVSKIFSPRMNYHRFNLLPRETITRNWQRDKNGKLRIRLASPLKYLVA
ncbi:MAG: hypothetical protein IKR48_02920, partial [Kiritimatiellae bacterium]|nr:hypothetical protein [Kiritimatiellia bacterium]